MSTERRPLDAYYTPPEVATKLVARIPNLGTRAPALTILEPSCGGGAFVDALGERWRGATIQGIDVDPAAPALHRGWSTIRNMNFLEWREPVDLVVGNPPFNEAQAHCEHAIKVARVGVGFLLRLAFLESSKRIAFWRDHRPHTVTVLWRRPSFTGGGTDSAAYGFFWWDLRQRVTETRLEWVE